MRIAFLSTWFPYPPDNGSKIRAYHLLRCLAARHEVTAMAFCPPAANHHSAVTVTGGMPHVMAVLDDPFRHVGAPLWVRYLAPGPLVYRASPAMHAAVDRLVGSEPFDAVVAVQVPVAQYALRIPAAARIVDVDTALTYQLIERQRAQRRLVARASTWVSVQKAHRYERRTLGRFHAATVASRLELATLRAMTEGTPCQAAVLPNGVDCAHHQPGLHAVQPHTLVFNGSLTYSANYDAMQWFLADIYPRIKQAQPHVSLTITGSTTGVDLSRLQLDSSVHLIGYVDDVRVPVAQSAVCVVPLRQGGGTRLKILEAMALGTPVVATTKGAEGLDVVDGEHLLLADDPAIFGAKTLDSLQNNDLRRRLTANARTLVEQHYDWNTIGGHFLDLVEDAAHMAQTPPPAAGGKAPVSSLR